MRARCGVRRDLHFRAPRLERQRGVEKRARRRSFFKQTDDGQWADVWVFDDKAMPLQGGLAVGGARCAGTDDAVGSLS